ncbi:MAG: extracellular solute-binding protein, partial [Chloroflexi bacterium]|nr:extracellular solute-binding protein [Chloroflexota bacterium]
MRTSKVTRRSFLRDALGMGAATLIVACGPAPAPTPTPVPAPAKPAEAPKPAAPTPTPAVKQAAPAGAKVTLRIGDTGQLKELFMWDKIVARFPQYELKLEEAPGAQYMDKLAIQLAGGTAPDMFYINNEDLHNWIDRGVFVGLNPYFASDKVDLNRFTADPRLGAGRGGIAYGLQQCIGDMPALIYNVEMFRKAGIKTPPKSGEPGFDTLTYEDELAMATALTKRRADGTVEQWGKLNPTSINHGWEYYIWGNGADLLDTPWTYMEATKSLLDSPECIQATQFMVDEVYKHKVTPGPEAAKDLMGLEPFFAGRVAITHYWVQFSLLVKAPFEWGVAWTPAPKQKVGTHYICHARSLGKASKYQDDAWAVLKYTHLDDEMLRLLAKKFRQPYDTFKLLEELNDPRQIEAEKVVMSRLR